MVAGSPPFEHLPRLSRVLGLHLASRAVALDEVSQQICDARPAVNWVPGKRLLPSTRACAMTLSTVGAHGVPAARVLMLNRRAASTTCPGSRSSP
jgi:hypothetical protein